MLWSYAVIDDLRPKCSGEDGDTVAQFFDPTIGGEYVNLYFAPGGSSAGSWFYGFDVPQRAAILLHEATHHWGFSHLGPNENQDQSFSQGPYTTEVIWLSDYATNSWAPNKLRCSSQDAANWLLSDNFVEETKFRIKSDDCPLGN